MNQIFVTIVCISMLAFLAGFIYTNSAGNDIYSKALRGAASLILAVCILNDLLDLLYLMAG